MMNETLLKYKSSLCGGTLWIFAFGVVLLMVVSFAISALYVEMNPDVTYYAGVSKQIMSGNVPYIDVRVDYTPLALYMLCPPISIFGNSWSMLLVYMYVVLLIDAIQLSLIIHHYTRNKALSTFGGGLFLVFAYMSEGVYFGLEAFVLLFGLGAILVLINKKNKGYIMLSGVLCACAFWSKQYGLGFAGICWLWILLQPNIEWKEKLNQILLFAGGFFGILVLFVGYYVWHGITATQIKTLLFGVGYGHCGIQGVADNGIWMLRRFPIFVLPLAFLPMFIKERKEISLLMVLVVAIFGFMFQCYFRPFYHYLILVWPFVIIFTLFTIDQYPYRKKYSKILLYILLILCVGRLLPRVVNMDKSMLNRKDRWEQMAVAEEISYAVPKRSINVLAYKPDMMYCQFYNDYTPPLLSKYGYTFGLVDTIPIDVVSASDYILMASSVENDMAWRVPSVQRLIESKYKREEIKANKLCIILYTRIIR